MTDRIAFVLAGIILALICVDVLIFGWGHLLFLAKKFADLIEWVAFWR